MKIMVIGQTRPDSFADNVAVTLEHMSHVVHRVGPVRRVTGPRRLRNAMQIAAEYAPVLDIKHQGHLIAAARAIRPDLVITLDNRMRPEIVDAIKRVSGPIVLWFPDSVANFGRHEMFSADYDRIYLKMQSVAEQLRSIYGLATEYLPEAANPLWHSPSGEYGTSRTIAVVGNIHPTRAILLKRLIDEGIPLEIYGGAISSWVDAPDVRALHSNREVVCEDKANTFRSARAVLNNLHPSETSGSNCRLFEAAASGAVVLTEWREEMNKLFVPGKEVIPFASFGQLVSECRQLLDDTEYGSAIADSAAIRARRDHTYEMRLQWMLENLEIA